MTKPSKPDVATLAQWLHETFLAGCAGVGKTWLSLSAARRNDYHRVARRLLSDPPPVLRARLAAEAVQTQESSS